MGRGTRNTGQQLQSSSVALRPAAAAAELSTSQDPLTRLPVPDDHPLHSAEIVDGRVLTLAEHGERDDETLLGMLGHDYRNPEESVRFVLVRLPRSIVDELGGSPEDYLMDEDAEDEEEAADNYRAVMKIAFSYDDDPASVNPVTIGPSPYGDGRQLAVYDGYHRLSAATESQASWIPAYVAFTAADVSPPAPAASA